MKRWIGFLGHLLVILVLTSFGTMQFKPKYQEVPEVFRVDAEVCHEVPNLDDATITTATVRPVFLGESYIGFKEAIGFKESRGKYHVVNTLGYLGKYQFGASTLKMMGITDTEAFLANAALQERAFDLNVARNKWILRRYIKRFSGKYINGVHISEAGIVAAAHLAGAGNVKRYLRSYGKSNSSDAYGSTIRSYMKRFSAYDISVIPAKHNPKI